MVRVLCPVCQKMVLQEEYYKDWCLGCEEILRRFENKCIKCGIYWYSHIDGNICEMCERK